MPRRPIPIRALRSRAAALPAVLAMAVVLGACGSTTASPSASAPAASGAVGGFGALPPVEGFSYRPAGTSVAVFVDSANATLAGDAQVQIVESALATRGDDEVLLIAFGFPGHTDEQSVDYMARIIDGLEDGFQAGSERGLGGSAYVIEAEDETLVIGPWGRTDHLVFLFALGPPEATMDLAEVAFRR
jgi:hypothetical protein